MNHPPSKSAGFPSWYVHQSLEDGATPARLVDFTKHRLGCDRVSVLIPKGRGWRVLEVSGVVKVHRHSTTVRAIEKSAQVLLQNRNRILHPTHVELSPQESEAIDRLYDATDACQFALLPLVPGMFFSAPFKHDSENRKSCSEREELIGALLCEHFSGDTLFQSQLSEIDEVTAHCTMALASWRYMGSLPGLQGLRFLAKIAGPLYRWRVISVLGLLIGLLVGASYMQTEHWVDATGELLPLSSRNIFAPSSAIVSEVLVKHGQFVKEGELLLRLHSSQLQQLESQFAGEIRTSQQRLIAIKSQRISGASVIGTKSSTTPTESYDPQMTELLQLEEKIQSLKLQLELTEAELSRLEILAPIAGQVATWDLERRLSERPVQSGDWLLTINDTSSDTWKLELKIPQPALAAVAPLTQITTLRQTSTRETETPTTNRLNSVQSQILFRIGSMPEKTFSATLASLSTATQVDDRLGNVVIAQAHVESALADWNLPSGSSVRAQIACGRKSVLAAYSFELKQWWYYNVDFGLRSYMGSLSSPPRGTAPQRNLGAQPPETP